MASQLPPFYAFNGLKSTIRQQVILVTLPLSHKEDNSEVMGSKMLF
ncbi:Uncharacterised protein [Yersinia enterocolitica]|nr:Uncharacterised protein [Yersinia mollaretii]CNJ84454.1 Uncharacterised protein [Yersinia mollaretii]CNK11570.1 Uncharacterised protein [Yersinia enterocolitica]CQQ93638.1 Uncharacterised protein [Yersinia mollaretii]